MSENQDIETLIRLFEKIKEQYTMYKEALVKQRNALISNNITELTNILTEMDGYNENISRFDARREFCMNNIIEHTSSECKTVRDIAEAYPEYKERLESSASSLKKEVLEVKKISVSNEELLAISRSIIKETISTIMTQNVDPRDRAWRTYGSAGGYSRTVRREPVHLVNQRG